MLMDSNSFAPSGQGPENNMTPQPSSTPPTPPTPPAPPIPPTPSPASSVGLGGTPNPLVRPTPAESAPTPPPAPEPTPTPTSATTFEPIPAPEATPIPEPAPEPRSTSIPISGPTPEPTPESQPTPIPISEPSPDPAPAPTPNPASSKKSHTKLFIILGSCLIGLALIIVLVFVVPFGSNGTLWDMITGGSSSSTTSGLKTGDEVETGGYTYYANLDLQYSPSGYFYDGMMRATSIDGATVFLDNTGNPAFTISSPYSTSSSDHFGNGLLPVSCRDGHVLYGAYGTSLDENGNYGYFDKTGNLAIPCQYASAGNFDNGYAVVSRVVGTGEYEESYLLDYCDDDGNCTESSNEPREKFKIQYGIIDTSGNLVVDFQDNEIDKYNTIKDGVYAATDAKYDKHCYNFQGEIVGTPDYTNADGCFPLADDYQQTTAAREAIKASLPDNYTVNPFREGLALVTSLDPLEGYFVDIDGNKVWEIDTSNLLDMDQEAYHEGLITIFVWDSDQPYPGVEALINGDVSSEDMMLNGAALFFDHQGQVVFRFSYADFYQAKAEEYQRTLQN